MALKSAKQKASSTTVPTRVPLRLKQSAMPSAKQTVRTTPAKQRRFEDLIAWRKARLLAREVYRLSARKTFAADPDLARGLRASVVEIMTFIAEGFEQRSLGDFYAFTWQAKAACAAARSQMYVAEDTGYLSEDDMTFLIDLTEDVLEVINELQAVIVRRMG